MKLKKKAAHGVPVQLPVRPSSRKKPTKPGRYRWKLPESEKSGYYTLTVSVEKRADQLVVVSDGDVICSLSEAKGGVWSPGWSNAKSSNKVAQMAPAARKKKLTLFRARDRKGEYYFSSKPEFCSGHDVFLGHKVTPPKNRRDYRLITRFTARVTGAFRHAVKGIPATIRVEP